jgi:hypothetical protein
MALKIPTYYPLYVCMARAISGATGLSHLHLYVGEKADRADTCQRSENLEKSLDDEARSGAERLLAIFLPWSHASFYGKHEPCPGLEQMS